MTCVTRLSFCKDVSNADIIRDIAPFSCIQKKYETQHECDLALTTREMNSRFLLKRRDTKRRDLSKLTLRLGVDPAPLQSIDNFIYFKCTFLFFICWKPVVQRSQGFPTFYRELCIMQDIIITGTCLLCNILGVLAPWDIDSDELLKPFMTNCECVCVQNELTMSDITSTS